MRDDVSYPLVVVKWVDSYGCGSQWGEIPDSEPGAHYCYSVGWLVRESVDAILLVPHISPNNDSIGSVEHGCGDMVIPRSAIREMDAVAPTR